MPTFRPGVRSRTSGPEASPLPLRMAARGRKCSGTCQRSGWVRSRTSGSKRCRFRYGWLRRGRKRSGYVPTFRPGGGQGRPGRKRRASATDGCEERGNVAERANVSGWCGQGSVAGSEKASPLPLRMAAKSAEKLERGHVPTFRAGGWRKNRGLGHDPRLPGGRMAGIGSLRTWR